MAEHQMEDTPNELEPESSNQHNSNVAMEDPVSLESGFQILPSDSGISNNSECELNKDNSFTQTSRVETGFNSNACGCSSMCTLARCFC